MSVHPILPCDKLNELNLTCKPLACGYSVLTGLGYTFVHPYGFNRMIPYIMKLAFKKINKLIVYNQDDQQVLTDRKIISEAQCTIAPGDGVDTTYFRPLSSFKNDNSFVFLFIGRLLRDKGIEEYVAAAKNIKREIPATEFWVVGDLNFGNPSDIGRGQLVEWIENQDISYFATTKDIRKYIQQCDVLVLPSYREGLPRVILEAMSMGKPIITSNTAGCREAVLHNENGLLVPLQDAKALTEAMLVYRTLPASDLETIGLKNRKRVMTLYATEKSTDRFVAFVKEILGEKIEKEVVERSFTG